MDIRKLQRAIVDGLEDVKAQHIAVFNTERLSALFERVIVATGASNRQTKSLAASVRDSVRGKGLDVMRTEGEENGEWIIVDCGAAVVHVMQPAIREYYHLEEIWGGKPVNMKFGAREAKGLPKASEPSSPTSPRSPVRSPSGKVSALAAARDRAAPAKKRATAKRPAAPRAGVPAVKKSPARSPARRKATPVTSAGPRHKAAAKKKPAARKPRA